MNVNKAPCFRWGPYWSLEGQWPPGHPHQVLAEPWVELRAHGTLMHPLVAMGTVAGPWVYGATRWSLGCWDGFSGRTQVCVTRMTPAKGQRATAETVSVYVARWRQEQRRQENRKPRLVRLSGRLWSLRVGWHAVIQFTVIPVKSCAEELCVA